MGGNKMNRRALFMLQSGEEQIVADRVRAVLEQASS